MIKSLAFLLLLTAIPAVSENSPATFEQLKVRHQEERKNFLIAQKQSKQRIRQQAGYMNKSEKGAFLKKEFQKLEEEKTNLMKRQAKERQEFFSKNPEIQSKSKQGAAKTTQRKKAALQKSQPSKP